jgi:hypothetical protein
MTGQDMYTRMQQTDLYVVTFDPRPVAGVGSIKDLRPMTLDDARALLAHAARIPKRGRIINTRTLETVAAVTDPEAWVWE